MSNTTASRPTITYGLSCERTPARTAILTALVRADGPRRRREVPVTPSEPPFAPDDPADPDRAWAWRDCGDGAEDADDVELEPIGPVDTDESYAAAVAHYPALVTPLWRR